MSEKNHPARIVVLRTASLETQLQKLWDLKPEIRDRISVTVAEAVAAFIREIEERKQNKLSEKKLLSSLVPSRVPEITEKSAPVKESEPHPDSSWG